MSRALYLRNPLVHRLLILMVVILALLWLGGITPARAEIVNVLRLYKLPKGLNWGQTEAEVVNVLGRERATITHKEDAGPAEIWEVKGLFISNLDSASFTMVDKKLEGVELRFGNPKWSEKKAQGIFGDFRVLTEHSLGAPSDSHKENTKQGDVLESTEALEWKAGDDIVRLVYFSASKKGEAFRLVSLHLTRKQAEDAMKAFAEAGAVPELTDPPGAGGPGETLFLVEPELPEGAAAATMEEEGLPADLFSEQNLQAGGDAAKTEVDALAIAAEAAAQVDQEAAAPPVVVQQEPGTEQAAAQALEEMAREQSATPAPPVPVPETAPTPETAEPEEKSAPAE